jgi:acyl-CoA reductase-like NAD-dependent aldehyde dehydrogenase
MVREPMQISSFNFSDKNGSLFRKFSPIDGQELCSFLEPNKNSISIGVEKLRRNMQVTDDLGLIRRAEILLRISDLIQEEKSHFAELVRLETGKPLAMSVSEVETAIQFMRAIAGASFFHSGEVLPSKNKRKLVIYERRPYGLAALIMSFNTPLPNYAWKFAPAWLAGNSVILKPSEHTPLSAEKFHRLCLIAGVPENSIGLLLGGRKAGTHLIQENLDLVSFTGSLTSGLEIQKNSSGQIRKTIMELGGSNPIIIFEDANVEAAVDAVIQSAFSNAGQRCAAGSRLLVHEDLFDSFLEKVQSRMDLLKIGTGEESQIGPVIDENALRRYDEYIAKAKMVGKVWMANVDVETKNKCVVRPALVFLGADSELNQEEIFSPILRASKFSNDDEALELANSTKFGLTAAIWTQSLLRIERFRNGLRTGVLNVNGPTHGSEFQFPFGGMNQSGNGSKEVGLESLDEYAFRRLVTLDFSN